MFSVSVHTCVCVCVCVYKCIFYQNWCVVFACSHCLMAHTPPNMCYMYVSVPYYCTQITMSCHSECPISLFITEVIPSIRFSPSCSEMLPHLFTSQISKWPTMPLFYVNLCKQRVHWHPLLEPWSRTYN